MRIILSKLGSTAKASTPAGMMKHGSRLLSCVCVLTDSHSVAMDSVKGSSVCMVSSS
jgi:hypothetical protein